MPNKKTFIILMLCISACQLLAQKKYNSLLWEISGNGLKKPSYLYGTMHVSNKLAFRLGEPFYKAISESDVVATELNPDVWFDDFVSSEEYRLSISSARGTSSTDGYKYDPGMGFANTRAATLKNIFQQDLSVINNLMYRISSPMANSEEDTYLDLYIYKCGKKLGKKAAGVETYRGLMNNVAESAKSGKGEKEEEAPTNPKDKVSDADMGEMIEDAYRKADLDALDSLSHINMTKREAEYILYKRNKIMGQFIDSVVKSKRLFIGVGAAHLPGEKGIIEWLRKKGYTVKPLEMGERDAVQRPSLDSLVYEQKHNTYYSPDSFYSVSVPGRVLDMVAASSISFQTGVDMVNGAYYSVARILSSSYLANESEEQVLHSIDSALYEDVPGDILSKQPIELSGYKGYDITNRTRRGDLQRHQLFITPDEVILFKLSGTDNFAASAEADKFFKSITLRPAPGRTWTSLTAPDKTFSISAPSNAFSYYSPALDNIDNRLIVLGSDPLTSNRFFALKHTYNVTGYIEKDSMELEDILVAFAKKAKYKIENHSYTIYKGRHAIYATYSTPDKRHVEVCAFNNQLNYYLLGVYYEKDTSDIRRFFESFSLQNRPYSSYTWYKDTTLHCKVKLPYVPRESSLSNEFAAMTAGGKSANADEWTKDFCRPGYDEHISVSFCIYDKYMMLRDTIYYKRAKRTLSLNYYQALNKVKTTNLKDGWQIDAIVSDTGSSQMIHKRLILKNGTRYLIQAYIDTLLGESEFAKTFFESFTPQDTVIGMLPFTNKSAVYLKDLYSPDTSVQNKAMFYKYYVRFEKENVKSFIQAIKNMPKAKKPVDLKVNLLENLAVNSEPEVVDFLKSEYPRYSDTALYQYAILRSLADISTPASISAFVSLITAEQPLGHERRMEQIFKPLIDSPGLVKDYFAELYPLSSIEDYKPCIIKLMAEMYEEKLLTTEQYKDKIPALLTEAKNEYKRNQQDNSKWDNDNKNLLTCYNELLMPFVETNTGVKNYFDKILEQGVRDARMETIGALIKNKKTVPDSLLNSIAADETKRLYLYRSLVKDSVTDRFPAKYTDAQLFSYTLAKMAMHVGKNSKDEDNDKDSLILLDKRATSLFDNSGTVYFYKIKSNAEKFWRLKVVGLEPVDPKAVLNPYNTLYVSETYYLDNAKEIKEQFDETLDEIIRQKIKYSNAYYKRFRDFTMTFRSATYL